MGKVRDRKKERLQRTSAKTRRSRKPPQRKSALNLTSIRTENLEITENNPHSSIVPSNSAVATGSHPMDNTEPTQSNLMPVKNEPADNQGGEENPLPEEAKHDRESLAMLEFLHAHNLHDAGSSDAMWGKAAKIRFFQGRKKFGLRKHFERNIRPNMNTLLSGRPEILNVFKEKMSAEKRRRPAQGLTSVVFDPNWTPTWTA